MVITHANVPVGRDRARTPILLPLLKALLVSGFTLWDRVLAPAPCGLPLRRHMTDISSPLSPCCFAFFLFWCVPEKETKASYGGFPGVGSRDVKLWYEGPVFVAWRQCDAHTVA